MYTLPGCSLKSRIVPFIFTGVSIWKDQISYLILSYIADLSVSSWPCVSYNQLGQEQHYPTKYDDPLCHLIFSMNRNKNKQVELDLIMYLIFLLCTIY